jgi:hypothetical protein
MPPAAAFAQISSLMLEPYIHPSSLSFFLISSLGSITISRIYIFFFSLCEKKFESERVKGYEAKVEGKGKKHKEVCRRCKGEGEEGCHCKKEEEQGFFLILELSDERGSLGVQWCECASVCECECVSV